MEAVAGSEVPLSVARCVTIGAAVALVLRISVQTDVQAVSTPFLIPCSVNLTAIPHTLVNRSLGNLVALRLRVQRLGFSLGIGKRIAATQRETGRQIEFQTEINASDFCFIDIAALPDGSPPLVIEVGKLCV